jgi:hypothetical protein
VEGNLLTVIDESIGLIQKEASKDDAVEEAEEKKRIKEREEDKKL